MKLIIVEPSTPAAGPILITDGNHNDVAEFFHSEHATTPLSYETALDMAKVFVSLPYIAQEVVKATFALTTHGRSPTTNGGTK